MTPDTDATIRGTLTRSGNSTSATGISCTRRGTNANPMKPKGTLIQNAHSQPPTSTSSAPSVGPMAVATDPAAAHAAIAVPRLLGGNSRNTSAAPAGVINALDKAWPARATSSTATFGARPQTTDATT